MRILHVGDDFAALRPCGLTYYADALMQAQVAAGHEVSYVFSGRSYPRLERPRLKRWRDRGVRMFELIGSPNHTHWERGTRAPLADLDEPAGAAAFGAALREARPDVVHIHELLRLPTSVIEMAKSGGVPVVMTLHDYKPLCASVRLLDADGQRCMRREVGEDCARNCARAPGNRDHHVDLTMDYELARAKAAVPGLRRVDLSPISTAVWKVKRLAMGADPVPGPPDPPDPQPAPEPAAPPADYQRRRDVNLERLRLCDRLVAPSRRVAEIYTELGVDPGRLVTQRLTLPHLEGLEPRDVPAVAKPLTFVTLGACASPSKGSRVVSEAVQALTRAGRDGHYRLVVLGHVEPGVLAELETCPSVELRGTYAAGDLDGLLDGMHVGLLPSIWEEVHGFVGIEMLAKGLPLVASALGGIPEYVVEGETGWLDRSVSGAGFAELMAAAIDDPASVERLRASVRARRAEIVRPVADHVAEVEALYAELTADQAAAMRSPASRRAAS